MLTVGLRRARWQSHVVECRIPIQQGSQSVTAR